jgi:hypothetical protein
MGSSNLGAKQSQNPVSSVQRLVSSHPDEDIKSLNLSTCFFMAGFDKLNRQFFLK